MDNADFDLLRFLRQLWSFIKRLFFFLLKFLVIVFLFEILFYATDFDFLDWVKEKAEISIISALGILGTLLWKIRKIEASERRRKERRQRAIRAEETTQEGPSGKGEPPSREKKTMGTRAGAFLGAALQAASKSGFCCLIAFCCLWLLMPACAAHFHPVAGAINQINQYAEDVRQSKQQPTSQQPTPQQPDNGPETQTVPQAQGVESEPPANSNFLEDPMNYLELTKGDYDQVYFRNSEWEIKDWTDQAAVNSTVTQFVKHLRSQEKPNKFDVEASSTMKLDVSNADTDYDAMTCSTQLDTTINTHLEAWAHPKYGLAWLLTNEYQEYGDHYYKENGHFETVEYYYGQSIIWAEEALKFESVKDYQIKLLLTYIGTRYHDIADYAEEGSTAKQHATVLYNAFVAIKNLDFG